MKTFFIALIIGIFAGSLITAYWTSPEAFEELKTAKNKLFDRQEEPAPEPEELIVEEQEEEKEPLSQIDPAPAVPMFKVAPKVVEPKIEEKPAPVEPVPSAPVESAKPEEKTRDTLEKSKGKAIELGEKAKEKAIELKDKAEPYLNDAVDLAIASAIRAQFKLDKRIESEQLEINVKDRHVTLIGSVSSGKIKQLAIEIAMTTKGVMQVKDDIQILDTE